MVKIGFDASAKGGPGIFLSRLQAILQDWGAFSVEQPDVWLQLSHKPLPTHLSSNCKLMVRTAGGYYYRHYLIKQPLLLPLPLLDGLYSQFRNASLNRPIENTLSRADGIVFQSEFTARMTRHFVYRPRKSQSESIILNGVDTQLFSPPPPSQRNGKTGLNILVSHQFRPHKRLHQVIEVVSKLRQHLPKEQPLMLHVLGGESRNAFSEAYKVIAREGMEAHVKFWGLQPSAELPAFYRRCDLMLALPLWDPCPNTVVEALSSGLPVITTSAGGIPELIGTAGRVIPEDIAMTYTDHHRFERIPKVDIDSAVKETLHVIESLDDYRVLARERALSALDIEKTARQYLDYAESLLEK